jgi:hypothetical protein
MKEFDDVITAARGLIEILEERGDCQPGGICDGSCIDRDESAVQMLQMCVESIEGLLGLVKSVRAAGVEMAGQAGGNLAYRQMYRQCQERLQKYVDAFGPLEGV